ncbi:MAG: hypothetical protein HQK89_03755 [Nitrospirae bacterium]|nr:hypothetical protein [Nitrospirota bacterium]
MNTESVVGYIVIISANGSTINLGLPVSDKIDEIAGQLREKYAAVVLDIKDMWVN